jgi:quinoprotein glucose dehydrogenase
MGSQRKTRLGWLAGILAFTCALALPSLGARQQTLVRGNAPGEWRYWGADAWSTRYSPLDQINASNFNNLQVQWKWNAAVDGSDEYYRTTPLYANGLLFTVATTHRHAYAVDPATGKTMWTWKNDETIRWQKAPRQFAGRGLAYWTDGRGAERVVVVTPGYHMAILDAKTGKGDPKIGKDGVIDLQEGLELPIVPLAVDDNLSFEVSDTRPARKAKPGETWDKEKGIGADGSVGIDPSYGQVANSCPAIIIGDVVVVGSSHIHGYYPTRVRNLPGWIRGYDIKTGKQLWKFNLIPQPGEAGAETWKNGSKIGTEGVGKNDAWAPYSADPDLGLVYIPVGMPLSDEYGGHRPGDNLYGNSLVALDVKTGKKKWHFQMVHHDIWDYDTPMAPNLLNIRLNGRDRRIIAQTTKQGFVYTFDRETGEPIWPMPETPVLQSQVPGEETSKTQPIPSKPLPYAQQGLEEDDLIDYTPEIKAAALHLAKLCRMGPYFIPPSAIDGSTPQHCSWYAPGASGGVNIDSGAAVDPETGMLYVASQTVLSTTEIGKDPCSELRYTQAGGAGPQNSCGKLGAPAPPPGYVAPVRGGGAGRAGDPAAGRAGGGAGAAGAAGAAAAGAGAGGRGAGGGGGRGGGGGAVSYKDASPGTSTIAGISIVKPKELGGITAYNMNTGDKAWWIPNGGLMTTPTPQATSPDAALFAGVKLPEQPLGRNLAQIITTKTLAIYGTGRGGGPPADENGKFRLYAVDKATGKQVGAVPIDTRTSAVPMTFMHQGRQYIVFATGVGANTALVALALPK